MEERKRIDRAHLNMSMMPYNKLIASIEQLEKDNIISFDEFKELPYHIIRDTYYGMIQPTQIRRAIIKIQDKRDGKEGLSEDVQITIVYKDGKPHKKTVKTTKF